MLITIKSVEASKSKTGKPFRKVTDEAGSLFFCWAPELLLSPGASYECEIETKGEYQNIKTAKERADAPPPISHKLPEADRAWKGLTAEQQIEMKNAERKSIEWQTCLKEAGELVRAGLAAPELEAVYKVALASRLGCHDATERKLAKEGKLPTREEVQKLYGLPQETPNTGGASEPSPSPSPVSQSPSNPSLQGAPPTIPAKCPAHPEAEVIVSKRKDFAGLWGHLLGDGKFCLCGVPFEDVPRYLKDNGFPGEGYLSDKLGMPVRDYLRQGHSWQEAIRKAKGEK